MARQSEQSERSGRSGRSEGEGGDRSQHNGQRNGGGGLHLTDVLGELPTDELKDETRELMSALGQKAMSVASDKIGGLTGKAVGLVANGMGAGSSSDDSGGSGEGSGSGGGLGGGGGSPVKNLLKAGASGAKDMIMNKIGGGKKGGGSKSKVTNIIEQIEVGVPVRVAYNQWTQFQDFPKFTKKIESVEQKSDEKVSWKAAIYFSHRTWESTIVEQVPDEHIVWRSQGPKGYVDGTVTFHELGPSLTKILVVLEYHPQGLFEKTGNAFRSQKRRARLELHHFDRHVMRNTILEQDDLEGWRGEIRDGEVVRSHEDALEEEQRESEGEDQGDEEQEDDELRDEDEQPEDDEYEDEYEGEGEDESEGEGEGEEDDEPRAEDEDEDYDEDEDEGEGEEDEEPRAEDEDEDEDTEYEDEYDDEEEPDEEEDEDQDQDAEYEDEWDEEPEEQEEPERHGGRRSARGRRREPAMSR